MLPHLRLVAQNVQLAICGLFIYTVKQFPGIYISQQLPTSNRLIIIYFFYQKLRMRQCKINVCGSSQAVRFAASCPIESSCVHTNTQDDFGTLSWSASRCFTRGCHMYDCLPWLQSQRLTDTIEAWGSVILKTSAHTRLPFLPHVDFAQYLFHIISSQVLMIAWSWLPGSSYHFLILTFQSTHKIGSWQRQFGRFLWV